MGHRSLGQASGEECGPCLCLRKAGILESSAQTWKEQRPLCIPESIWSMRHPGSLNETTPDVSSCVRRTGDLASEGFTLSLLPKVRPQGPIWSPSSVLEQRKNATSSFLTPYCPFVWVPRTVTKTPGPRVRRPGLSFCPCQ